MNQFLAIHGNVAMSLFEKDAPSSALRVFMTLCLYANIHDNTCFPSINTLMEDTNLKERTVRDALDWLVTHDFISRAQTFLEFGRQTSNTYTVHNKGAEIRRGEGAENRTPILKSTSKERKTPLSPKGEAVDLDALVSSEFPALVQHLPAIREWLAYKREKKQSYKPLGLTSLLRRLSSMLNPSEAIHNSMAMNYSGVYEKSSGGGESNARGPASPKPIRPPTAEQLERMHR